VNSTKRDLAIEVKRNDEFFTSPAASSHHPSLGGAA
jgi:hypothetical protein